MKAENIINALKTKDDIYDAVEFFAKELEKIEKEFEFNIKNLETAKVNITLQVPKYAAKCFADAIVKKQPEGISLEDTTDLMATLLFGMGITKLMNHLGLKRISIVDKIREAGLKNFL